MAKLKYIYSTMRAGKSTLLLQMNNNFKIVDQNGLLFTMNDRSGKGVITSRIGIEHRAVALEKDSDIYDMVKRIVDAGGQLDYLLFDEVQFYTEAQIHQIANIVDEFEIDSFCFGLKSDFKGNLFDSAKVLFVVADEIREVEVKALCWCGRKALYNSRLDGEGYMTLVGQQEQVGDRSYEVLCREHYAKGKTKRVAFDEGLLY